MGKMFGIRQLLARFMSRGKIRREEQECKQGIDALKAVVPESPDGGWLVDDKGTILNPPFEIPVRQYRDQSTAAMASAAIREEMSRIEKAKPEDFISAEQFIQDLSNKVVKRIEQGTLDAERSAGR